MDHFTVQLFCAFLPMLLRISIMGQACLRLGHMSASQISDRKSSWI